VTTEVAIESTLLVAAQRGDEQAFVRLTAVHRRALHRHCYRMLGSLDDADDALQETMLRAWRALPRYQPTAPLRAWLYRIATNVCLTAAEHRARDRAGIDRFLQPYPDALLDDLPAPEAGPEAIAEAREDIGLALVAAMQDLTPKQRAVLVRGRRSGGRRARWPTSSTTPSRQSTARCSAPERASSASERTAAWFARTPRRAGRSKHG
jgi:RNA polymerase sigma-70 factor (ECF subfamily)